MALQVSSPAFAPGSDIPRKHTCDGQDAPPPLDWSGIPNGAKSVAIICEDPDAPSGTFTHWVLYNLPASADGIPEHAKIGTSGVNSFGRIGYGGPCPPRKDPAHHYHFHVYALDVESLGGPGLSREDVSRAMRGHLLAEGELVGTYRRRA
jgi:Raf kinase inhibitor-like YbhB/YbcL family protein